MMKPVLRKQKMDIFIGHISEIQIIEIPFSIYLDNGRIDWDVPEFYTSQYETLQPYFQRRMEEVIMEFDHYYQDFFRLHKCFMEIK
jgi:hypothetical protein